MPSLEQQVPAPAPAMVVDASINSVETEQPKTAPQMSTSADEVRMRGGEYASCDCCGCGCSEFCC